jgi:hypothetical protein
VLALLLVAAILSGCRAGNATVAFRPRPGARYLYHVDVATTTVTRIGTRPATTTVDHERLVVRQTVLSVSATGADVRVVIDDQRGSQETLRVQYDRADHLTGVQRQDNLPVSVLGQLGLAEVFPASIDAPPGHALRPGDAWAIDAPLELGPGTGSSVTRGRVLGRGRLVELRTRGSQALAVIHTTLAVPVNGANPAAGGAGPVDLQGRETTTSTATRRVPDGVVQEETSTTQGRFTLRVQPPPDAAGPDVPGTLSVTVRATTTLAGSG